MFNQFVIKDVEEFKTEILNALGNGTFDVEIWPENWNYIFRKSYQLYTKYAYNMGYKHTFIPIILEPNDNTYDLSRFNLTAALSVKASFDEFGSLERLSMYQGMFMDMFSASSSGAYIDRVGDFLIDYANFQTMKDVFRKEFSPTYYTNTGVLEIHPKPKVKAFGFVECYVAEEFENLFNDPLFMDLTTAIAKGQWYENLAKFTEMDFAGKGKINVERLKEESEKDFEKVMKDIREESDGVSFFIS